MFQNRFGEIRSGWMLALSFATMLLAEAAAAVVVGLAAGLGFILSGSYLSIAEQIAMVQVLSRVGLVFLLILIFKLFYKRPVFQMGFGRKRWCPLLMYGCLLGIAAIVAAWGLLLLTGQASVASVRFDALRSADFWLSLALFIAVGFAEETLSRGFIMTALKTTRSRAVIMLVPAALFSLLHALNPNVSAIGLINIFLIGIVFGYMFVRTGSIWMPIGFHITWNFVQGNILGMAVSGSETVSVVSTTLSGPDWITGGAFGAEGGVAVTLVCLLALLFVRFCVRKPADPAWTFDSDLPLTRVSSSAADPKKRPSS